MSCEVEYTDEFEQWWEALTDSQQEDVAAIVEELERRGANLPYPYSSKIQSSKYSHMRELRIQSGGHPLRVFYAFDPRRIAMLLIAGDKTGDDMFYEHMVPVADNLYAVHIEELKKEQIK
ncbi:type II toxin-antitoxin system RelE/ParE family toxin [Solidesulfovibrio alcoholivorans]|uniref:type II toxin-antitoxin system RelE/ParE family toxin n=1 Tax=Solidesulfovibrio alcoholivorans TaxID=81406 RepID=UPI0004975637|nr:type II toxin-antitoxin system RelE/ParE family toxin [Solidesulfovibrio alcoholivorans]